MKNQYFGDNKDLFKYDLVLTIMKAGLVKHFTFVPMLTEPKDNNHGKDTNRRQARAGARNEELVSFLGRCLSEDKRDFERITEFFYRHAVSMTIHCDDNRYFTHQQRQSYFAGIGDELLRESLILIDPDSGLEVKRSGEEHILYSELGELYRRMDTGSMLMVFQYFPRESHRQYLNRRCEEIKEKITGDWPICIDDDEIIFFFLTKDESLEKSLTQIVREYAERYSSKEPSSVQR